MDKKNKFSRRAALKAAGTAASLGLVAQTACANDSRPSRNATVSSKDIRKTIFDKVAKTPFIDTHEHLIEEADRIAVTPGVARCDDWSITLNGYTICDIVSAGLSQADADKFFFRDVDPLEKWRMIEPYWPAVKNTGYAQAVLISMKQLYGVDELSAKTIKKVIEGYEKTRQPGFYKRILVDMANIESCQVNYLAPTPFKESAMPTLLMQDLSIMCMYQGPDFKQFGDPTGIKVENLSDWHRVIDWWFNKYGKYAVAVKSQNAYSRDINYAVVPEENVEAVFLKTLNKQPVSREEKKALEDHLFWYAVKRSTENKLPVKLHTGYYAGSIKMPLSRLINNPGSACDLCRTAPDTRFVFMHICYPYYEEMISIAKQYTNAYMDMCWAWLINPEASKDFLKKFLVTAPANKILTFGGDLIGVEPVLGHAGLARRGIALALSELVEDGWFSLDDALALTDPIMHGNARQIFNLPEKEKILANVKWS